MNIDTWEEAYQHLLGIANDKTREDSYRRHCRTAAYELNNAMQILKKQRGEE